MRHKRILRIVVVAAAAATFLASTAGPGGQSSAARLEVRIVEERGDGIVPCRIQLTANGKPVYPPKLPIWKRDATFCCPGEFSVDVPAGSVEIVADRGTEWNPHTERLEIEPGQTRRVEIAVSRWIDMNERGWFSGDLHIHRPPNELGLLLRANDLNVAPDLTHWNQRHLKVAEPYLRTADAAGEAKARLRFLHLLNQEDERFGGAILMFNLTEPILLKGVYRHWPTGMAYQRRALDQTGVHIEQEKPFWWEAPVNVALGRIDSIGICHNHFNRRGLMENEAWGRARDRDKYPGQLGFCLYTLDLYYRYLNLGWDIAASAGSASGVLANPVGYNRTYVRPDKFEKSNGYEEWFEAFRAGHNFVTNGPMLFATVNDRPIGTRFDVAAGERFNAKVRFEVVSRAPLDRVEIVVGGEIEETVRATAAAQKKIAGEFSIPIERSTWIAVRAFEKHRPTPRFAHTSPFYFAVGGKKRRDPEAARFYVRWIDDLIAYAKRERPKFQSEEHFNGVIETYKKARGRYAELAGEE